MTKQDTFVRNLLAVLQSFDGEFKVKKMPKGYILTGIVLGDAKRIKVFFSGDRAQLNGLSFNGIITYWENLSTKLRIFAKIVDKLSKI